MHGSVGIVRYLSILLVGFYAINCLLQQHVDRWQFSMIYDIIQCSSSKSSAFLFVYYLPFFWVSSLHQSSLHTVKSNLLISLLIISFRTISQRYKYFSLLFSIILRIFSATDIINLFKIVLGVFGTMSNRLKTASLRMKDLIDNSLK